MFSLDKSFAQIKDFMLNAGLVEENDNQNEQEEKTEEKKDREAKTEKNRIGKARKKENKRMKKQKISFDPEAMKKGVILIKNFPHGFYEEEMTKYFSQFGEVTRVKIARSRKTGKPKSYGFIEFRFIDVAKIAAQTMDNYLMFDKIVRCKVLSEESMPENLFKNWKRPFVSSVKLHKDKHNADKSDAQEYRLLKKRLARLDKQQKKLEEIGVDFKCCVVNRPTELEKKAKSTLSKMPKTPTSKFEMVELKQTRPSPRRVRQRIPVSAVRFPRFFRLFSAWSTRKTM